MSVKTETYQRVYCPKCKNYTGIATVTRPDGEVMIRRWGTHDRCDWFEDKKEENKK